MTEAIAQATRRYAKRQLTWFRKEPGVAWLAGFGDYADVIATACAAAEAQFPALAVASRPRSA